MLMLMLMLGRRMLGLPGERQVRRVIFGLAFGAVKLCWGKGGSDERRCEETTDSVAAFELGAASASK